MIPLLQPLQLEHKSGSVCLVLWLCEPFDAQYSFRSALQQIEQTLGGPASVSYALPPEEPSEDFVEGHFFWEGRAFSLYYERSLGYMQFSSVSHADVQALHVALSPNPSIERTSCPPLRVGQAAAHVKR